MGKKNQWLIKNKEGLVEGPFSTSEVLNRIKEKEDVEGEFVSLYPNQKWVPVQDYDSFYDVLFKILSDELKDSEEEKESWFPEGEKEKFSGNQEEEKKGEQEGSSSPTDPKEEQKKENTSKGEKGEGGEEGKGEFKEEGVKEETRTVREKDLDGKEVQTEGDIESQEIADQGKEEEQRAFDQTQIDKGEALESKELIEKPLQSAQIESPFVEGNVKDLLIKDSSNKKLGDLKDQKGKGKKSHIKNKKGKHFFRFFLFILIFSLGVFLFIGEDSQKKLFKWFEKEVLQNKALQNKASNNTQNKQTKEEKVSLLFPKRLNQKIPRSQIVQMVKRGFSFIERGTFENDLRAMNEWAEALRGSKNNKNILGLLCISYFKLFPFTEGSFKEIQAVSKAFLRVSYLYPLSLQAYICENVLLRMKEKSKEVQHLMKKSDDYFSLLKDLNKKEKKSNRYTKRFLAFLFYFKTLDFKKEEEFHEAYESISYAQQLWPKNVQFYTEEAKILENLNQYKKALAIHEKILKKRPSQKESLIYAGYIRASYVNDVEGGQTYLNRVFFEEGNRAFVEEGRVSVQALSRAYFGLARIFFKKREISKAFEYAKKSYHFGFEKAGSLLSKLDKKNRPLSYFSYLIQDRFLIERGNEYLDRGQYHEAEVYFNKAYEKKGTYIGKAAFKVGLSLWKMNLRGQAFKWFNRALVFDRYNEEAYFYIADYLGKSYDFREAEKVLSQALSLMPRSYILLRAFSLLEKRRGHFQNMVAYAEEALQLYELDLKTYSLLVDGLMELNRFNEAFSYASRALEVDPHSPFVHVSYARALANIKGQDDAIQYLKRELQKSPNEVGYLLEIAELMDAGGDYEGAVKHYFSAMEKSPRYKETYFKLGKMYKRLKNWNEALEVFLKALSLDPQDADPLFEIAKIYLDLKNDQEAVKYFSRTLQVNPKYPLAHLSIGKINLRKNQPLRALKHAKGEKKVNRYNTQAYILAAQSYYRLKQYNLCVDEYQEAIKRGNKQSGTYVRMAECARLSGSLDVALSLLNVAESLESGNPLIYRELGLIFEAKGEFERAKRSFDKYFSLNPKAKDRSPIQQRLGGRR